MLEHQKIVLSGVSDNQMLFRKELSKSMQWLNTEQQRQLGRWVRENFNHQHAQVIDEVLNGAYDVAS